MNHFFVVTMPSNESGNLSVNAVDELNPLTPQLDNISSTEVSYGYLTSPRILYPLFLARPSQKIKLYFRKIPCYFSLFFLLVYGVIDPQTPGDS